MVPANYNYMNAWQATHAPMSLHCKDNQLTQYFARYLLQKAISVFKWEFPEEWNGDYFLYVLYCFGYIAVVNTDLFGPIPQQCGLKGYDVFYQPSHAIIVNPKIKGILEPRIGAQCTLFKLQPNFSGIMDVVMFYAELMAIASQTAIVNMMNSHLSFVFSAQNKASAESFKKLMDQIAGGELAAVIDSKLFRDDGTPSWYTFQQNVGQNYIADKVLQELQNIECQFDTEIGLPNSGTEKKDRLIPDEVNANNQNVYSRSGMWLQSLQKACDQCREMFGVGPTVDWRLPPMSYSEVYVEGGAEIDT